MTDKADDITQANEAAKKEFEGKAPVKRPTDGKTVTDVNEAADAEFHDDEPKTDIGNNVGGLRGSSD